MERNKTTRVAVHEWREANGGIWHAFVGAESEGSACLQLTRDADAAKRRHRQRRNGVRVSLPTARQRVCPTCAEEVGLVRRKARAASSVLPIIRGRLEHATKAVVQELKLWETIVPPFVAAARAAVAHMPCGFELKGEPECVREAPDASCQACLARWRLEDETETFAVRSARIPVDAEDG